MSAAYSTYNLIKNYLELALVIAYHTYFKYHWLSWHRQGLAMIPYEKPVDTMWPNPMLVDLVGKNWLRGVLVDQHQLSIPHGSLLPNFMWFQRELNTPWLECNYHYHLLTFVLLALPPLLHIPPLSPSDRCLSLIRQTSPLVAPHQQNTMFLAHHLMTLFSLETT